MKGLPNWLTTLPISDFGFKLSNQDFWDAIRLRCGWSIANLPKTCPCGSRFSVQHCMSCKKGIFVSIRHNDLRDLTANMLSEVCKDVEIEPKLTRLTGKELGGELQTQRMKQDLTLKHTEFGKERNKYF